MRKSFGLLVRGAIGTLVAAALVVGGSELFAQPVQESCTYNPPTFLGYCNVGGPHSPNYYCAQDCSSYGDYYGTCNAAGCCICFLGE